ncbi:MAG TPA: tetratricopeptide repeat protein [Kiritimatiellia bacterium]|nr:tetratricopeptide repeat protein [Kiritimatiellia bacterium]HRR32921.1 tetratricopeptide repeat protein [Kiritimatiellia bacterium]
MSLKKWVCLLLAGIGIWGFPLEGWAKEKHKEPKVSELLQPANELMSQASAAYVDGRAKEAIEGYRKALAELARLEREHPARVTSSEFAPVRFRKALCETEIDRIMLEEMNATARTVAVTDTSALEAKRAARKKEAETNNLPEAAVKLAPKKGETPEPPPDATAAGDGKSAPAGKPINIRDELEWAKDMLSVDRFDEVEASVIKVLKQDPENVDARLLMALSNVQQGKHRDASVVLDDLLQDVPRDEAVLLLAAGCYAASGNYSKAMTTLDKALTVNPKRPDGYLNMAWLLLEMAPGKLDEPEMYYRQAVKLGAARDRDLERRLGIRQE